MEILITVFIQLLISSHFATVFVNVALT